MLFQQGREEGAASILKVSIDRRSRCLLAGKLSNDLCMSSGPWLAARWEGLCHYTI